MQTDSTGILGETHTPYDTIWAGSDAPLHSSPLEQLMLADDKIYVVLAVILIIWFGLMLFVLRTDKKLGRMEREMDESIDPGAPESPHTP